ncbi:hypothetical protein JOF41_001944 [Saccharothrix coeruleofusca]|nr:hypothetical protein [Saccharothrix coeruleofusca]
MLVTSRHRLPGLVTGHGAHQLHLDVLTDEEARALLTGRLGAGRVTAEREAVDELIALCDGFPLALGILAARAEAEPTGPSATPAPTSGATRRPSGTWTRPSRWPSGRTTPSSAGTPTGCWRWSGSGGAMTGGRWSTPATPWTSTASWDSRCGKRVPSTRWAGTRPGSATTPPPAMVAGALDHVGLPLAALGLRDEARAVWREALALYRDLERDEDAERLLRRLEELDGAERAVTG